jgi:hypothetical protein
MLRGVAQGDMTLANPYIASNSNASDPSCRTAFLAYADMDSLAATTSATSSSF